MSTLHEAAQQALEVLHNIEWHGSSGAWMLDDCKVENAIHALRAALAADDGMCGARALARAYENGWNAAKADPAQEPVVWLWPHQLDELQELKQMGSIRAWSGKGHKPDGVIPLYTAPPQRKPLSDEQIELAYRHIYRNLPYEFDHSTPSWVEQGIKYAERAHGIGGSNE